ncbi:hypothetical protein U27_01954 [Candidatus Vecturithrix granuli]|uniref:Uncharacterized protein n=1 Tax=Vecturithrix granuli TaxID=1499967 RepID=A0A0S6WAI5_VECG1|nr:hypothetical protein U27_01954 [Candidatus Vecturithrix granuli]
MSLRVKIGVSIITMYKLYAIEVEKLTGFFIFLKLISSQHLSCIWAVRTGMSREKCYAGVFGSLPASAKKASKHIFAALQRRDRPCTENTSVSCCGNDTRRNSRKQTAFPYIAAVDECLESSLVNPSKWYRFYGKRTKPIPTWVKWASPVKISEIPSSRITTIELRSVNEIFGLS